LRAVFAVCWFGYRPDFGVARTNPSTGTDCPSALPPANRRAKATIEPHREVIAVTGTYTPIPVENIDRSLDIIDTRENSLLYDHWVDYLHADPSIDLRQRGPNDVQADLSIRGSTFGQTLVLLNGLRIERRTEGWASQHGPANSYAFTGAIEVLRGAGSSFYGSDAVGGSSTSSPPRRSYSEIRAGTAIEILDQAANCLCRFSPGTLG
jgi:iron complex outermembrane receptor protein